MLYFCKLFKLLKTTAANSYAHHFCVSIKSIFQAQLFRAANDLALACLNMEAED